VAVKGALCFALFRGGAKFAGLEQARETLAGVLSLARAVILEAVPRERS